jgi:hypothetical protein
MVDGNAWKVSGRQEERVLQVGRRKREERKKEGVLGAIKENGMRKKMEGAGRERER